MLNQTKTRIKSTRDFFKCDSWSMDAADAWQYVLTGACDDDDMYDNDSFNALDMDNMFNEYRVFGIACNDAFHFLIEHVDAIFRLAGFIYIDGENGAVEFTRSDNGFGHARAEWLFECHRDEAGTLLRVVVDSAGAIGIELVD